MKGRRTKRWRKGEEGKRKKDGGEDYIKMDTPEGGREERRERR